MEEAEEEIAVTLTKKKSRYQPKRDKSKYSDIFSEITLKTTKDIFQCEFCPSLFANENQLKYHLKSHFGIEEYKCDECQCVFSSANKLERHKQKIHCETLLCKYCQANFNHINSLKLHLRLHTGEKPYVCNECGSKFVQSSHLSIHKRSHTGEKPYQCNICKQTFKQISHLRTHERIHTQIKPYSCEYCGNSFIQKSSLKRHIRIHTGERPYKCQECNAAFCVKNNLTRHMVVHTGEHPYICDLCDSSFSQPIDLKRHKVSHTGIKPFTCDQCEASFSRKNNLKWHRMIHTGETPFKCESCENQYCKPRDLKKHLLTHDPRFKASMCQICGQVFPQAVSLKRHMKKIHNGNECHSCKECSASFADKSSLKRHMYKHRCSSNFQCSDCKCEFNDVEGLNSHMESHNLKVSKMVSTIMNEDEKQECLQLGTSKPSEEILDQKLAIPFSLASDYLQQCTTNLVSSPEIQLNSLNYPAYVNFSSLQTLPQPAPVQTIIMSSGSNQPMKLARLAANCGNHNMHIHILGHNNQVQSWCFCENLNLPPEGAQSNTCFSDLVSDTSPISSEEPNLLQTQNDMENQSSVISEQKELNSIQMFNSNPLISDQGCSSHHSVVDSLIPANMKPSSNDQFQIICSGQYPTNQYSTLWLSNGIEA